MVSDEKNLAGLPWVVALSQAFGVVVIVLICIWLNNYLGGFGWSGESTEFNVHPLCMVVGMVFLFGEGMMVYRIFRNASKLTAKLIHTTLMILAFVASVVGLVAVFQFHNHKGIPNMYSLHSWCGMTTILMFGLQLVLGFLTFLIPGAQDNLKAFYLPFHQYWGSAIFTFAGFACISGINEKLFFLGSYVKLLPTAVFGNVLGLMIVAFIFCVLFVVHYGDWKRPPSDEEEVPLVVSFRKVATHDPDE